MKVILLEIIENLGNPGDVVNVKRGYARNYLVPRKLAIYATPANMKRLTVIKENFQAEEEKRIAALKVLAEKIASTKLTFVRKFDEHGSMFGSVSENDIVNALKAEGIDVHRSMILLERSIKAMGEQNVEIRLHREVIASLDFMIEAERVKGDEIEEAAEAEAEAVAEPETEATDEPETPEVEEAEEAPETAEAEETVEEEVAEETEQETQPTEEPAAEIEE